MEAQRCLRCEGLHPQHILCDTHTTLCSPQQAVAVLLAAEYLPKAFDSAKTKVAGSTDGNQEGPAIHHAALLSSALSRHQIGCDDATLMQHSCDAVWRARYCEYDVL